MLPHEILSTEHLRQKPKKIDHPNYHQAFEVEAHRGEQAGFEVWGFICPKCHVACAVNGITDAQGNPTDYLHACGAYIQFVAPQAV